VHVVAVFELATTVEVEAALLAADLGTTAYEERLKLVAGLPAIVLNTADPASAQKLCAKIEARGHTVRQCDTVDVVASESMIPLRRFAFEPDALLAVDVPGARLPYADISALIRAASFTRTETRTQTKSKQFSPGRALLSGGLVLRKAVTTEEKSVSSEREPLLYVFPADGTTPWVLRERGTQYAGLGAAIGSSSAQNFATFVALLRDRAPGAVYDERLVAARSAPSRIVRGGGGSSASVAVSSASGVDLMAHLLALWATTRR
jgi:hypothetical protein